MIREDWRAASARTETTADGSIGAGTSFPHNRRHDARPRRSPGDDPRGRRSRIRAAPFDAGAARGGTARPPARLGRQLPHAPGAVRRSALSSDDRVRPDDEFSARRGPHLAAPVRPHARYARPGSSRVGGGSREDRAHRRMGASRPRRGHDRPGRSSRLGHLRPARRGAPRPLRGGVPGAHHVDAVRAHRPARRRIPLRDSRPRAVPALARPVRREPGRLARPGGGGGVRAGRGRPRLAGGNLLGSDLRSRARPRGDPHPPQRDAAHPSRPRAARRRDRRRDRVLARKVSRAGDLHFLRVLPAPLPRRARGGERPDRYARSREPPPARPAGSRPPHPLFPRRRDGPRSVRGPRPLRPDAGNRIRPRPDERSRRQRRVRLVPPRLAQGNLRGSTSSRRRSATRLEAALRRLLPRSRRGGAVGVARSARSAAGAEHRARHLGRRHTASRAVAAIERLLRRAARRGRPDRGRLPGPPSGGRVPRSPNGGGDGGGRSPRSADGAGPRGGARGRAGSWQRPVLDARLDAQGDPASPGGVRPPPAPHPAPSAAAGCGRRARSVVPRTPDSLQRRVARGRQQLRIWIPGLDPLFPGGERGGGDRDGADARSSLDRRDGPRAAHERLRVLSRPSNASRGAPGSLAPTGRYFDTMQSRLYDFDGAGAQVPGRVVPPLSHFRLRFRSQTGIQRGNAFIARWKVFELLPD